MISSNNPDRIGSEPCEPPLVGDGGLERTIQTSGDPFEALADLMEVVEALCPIWPVRHSTLSEGRFLL